MSDDPHISYVENDEGQTTHVVHTYYKPGRSRNYVYKYETGLFGLGPDTGECVCVVDNFSDGTQRVYEPGDESWIW